MKASVAGFLWVALTASTGLAGTCDPKTIVGSTHKVTAAEARVNPRPTDKVTGKLADGASAEVISVREVDGKTWFLVRWPEGNTKKAGWIESTHLVCD